MKMSFLDSRKEMTSDKSQDARGKEFLDLKKCASSRAPQIATFSIVLTLCSFLERLVCGAKAFHQGVKERSS